MKTLRKSQKNNFLVFNADIILQRAIEPDLEIIGEALKKLILLEPTIQITSMKNIIGLRNIIAHAYDAVEPEMIWAIIQKDIPLLTLEMNQLG